MAAYYNENDPYAAQWLRNLIAAGLIDLNKRLLEMIDAEIKAAQSAPLNMKGE